MKWSTLILAIFACCSLSACAPYKIGERGSGACNQLNSQMIFSGSTSNIRKADIEAAEEPGIQRTYEKQCEK